MKTTEHHSTGARTPSAEPMEQDSPYTRSGGIDPAMKQAVAQEERRSSRHSGKTIKRPIRVTRTMSA